jgi:hypothetical protein
MRSILFATAAVWALLVSGCGSGAKPTEEQCRLVVENIRKINRTNESDVGARPEAMVRSCRARSSREAVECMIAAKTVQELEKCEGYVGAEHYEAERALEEKEKAGDKPPDSEKDEN